MHNQNKDEKRSYDRCRARCGGRMGYGPRISTRWLERRSGRGESLRAYTAEGWLLIGHDYRCTETSPLKTGTATLVRGRGSKKKKKLDHFGHNSNLSRVCSLSRNPLKSTTNKPRGLVMHFSTSNHQKSLLSSRMPPRIPGKSLNLHVLQFSSLIPREICCKT